jgi:hypothetical protein
MDKEEINKVANKIAQYRGVIIHDSISIDAMLGAIIAVYFAKDNKNNEFNRKVIDDEYFSFGLKIRIFKKLDFEVYPQFFEDIWRINNIRNIFAHQVPTLDEGFFKKGKDGKENKISYMVDLHKEFLKKIKNVNEQLHKIFLKLVEENKQERSKNDGGR